MLSNTVSLEAASPRIFPYTEAEAARRLAQRECKPLVLHFIPDTEVGAKQLDDFYAGRKRIPNDILDQVVIVVLPIGKYARFAKELGINGPGGYRTISAFDLSPFDKSSQPTCRSGFR